MEAGCAVLICSGAAPPPDAGPGLVGILRPLSRICAGSRNNESETLQRHTPGRRHLAPGCPGPCINTLGSGIKRELQIDLLFAVGLGPTGVRGWHARGAGPTGCADVRPR